MTSDLDPANVLVHGTVLEGSNQLDDGKQFVEELESLRQRERERERETKSES